MFGQLTDLVGLSQCVVGRWFGNWVGFTLFSTGCNMMNRDRGAQGRKESPIFNINEFRGVCCIQMNSAMRSLLGRLLGNVLECARADNMYIEPEMIAFTRHLNKQRTQNTGYRISGGDAQNDDFGDDDDYEDDESSVDQPGEAASR